ncbi:hypothetical protein ACE1SV_09200 [Streptomyces sp. E-15]
MPDRRDEPPAGIQGRRPADPADRAGGQALFTGWGGELATCRKFAPTARNYTASQIGLRVSQACKLDLADITWNLGRFGKLHVRQARAPAARARASGRCR